jgi:hypothetical protein
MPQAARRKNLIVDAGIQFEKEKAPDMSQGLFSF